MRKSTRRKTTKTAPLFSLFSFSKQRALFQTFHKSNLDPRCRWQQLGALGEISLGSGSDKPPPTPTPNLPSSHSHPLFLVHSNVCFLISAEAAAAAPTNIRLCGRLQTNSRWKAEGTFPCNRRGRRHLDASGREVESKAGVGGDVLGDEKCRNLSPTFPFHPLCYPRLGHCSALQQN